MTAPVRPSSGRRPQAQRTDLSRAEVAQRVAESRQALALSFDCLAALAVLRDPRPPS